MGNTLGEAGCIQGLGDVALRRSDPEAARKHYEAALPLFRNVGNALGDANCIQGLGNVALHRSDFEAARQQYEAALPLFRKAGSVDGEAGCIKSLGDIDEAEGVIVSACERWCEALALYGKIPDPYSIGSTHLRLARRAATPAEAAEHRKAARKAWESIDRPDLIEQYLDKEA